MTYDQGEEGAEIVMSQRWAILVKGVVQGVGYRPFVYAAARELGVSGWVRNEVGGVRVEAEAKTGVLEKFVRRLGVGPALARVESVSFQKIQRQGETGFKILESGRGEGEVVVTPDAGICQDCLREMFDPLDRRYRYAFINCTNCGPRLTIVTGAPYDRQRTTMAQFVMCEDCRWEYHDPGDRRFHAQPVACPNCGPRLKVLDREGKELSGDPIEVACEILRGGGIAAIKGVGGFHLACDARNETAVAELRRRKHRDEKPFAVMVRNLAEAEELCEMSAGEREALTGWRRPIVLLKKRKEDGLAQAVAPGNPFWGVMVAYAPVHHLLLHAMGPSKVLVMTSGNRADEPIAYEDADAVERLRGIVDVFVVHDREIRTRCDDSVTRIVGGEEYLLRRSRGYAPEPIGTLPSRHEGHEDAPHGLGILAVGGQLKGTFALASGEDVVVSHHLGDLDHLEAYRAFVRDIGLYEELFKIRPAVIAHDLHPDYASTRYARERAQTGGVKLVAVQHHHAHMASCMVDNELNQKVIGVSFDGTGYGLDGAIWGGEFLVGGLTGFERAAHLRYVGLPGGDAAVKEIWRMGLVQMLDAGASCRRFTERLDNSNRAIMEKMLERRINTPTTSSMGRLFDAVAAIAGVHGGRGRVSFEGQGAMEFEWAGLNEPQSGKRESQNHSGEYRFGVENLGAESPNPEKYQREMSAMIVDPRPVIRAVCEDVDAGVKTGAIARGFHAAVVEMIVEVCARIREKTGVRAVVLSGGVFMNLMLLEGAMRRLSEEGFSVHRHRRVPANDGGLCLGQLAVAAATIQGRA